MCVCVPHACLVPIGIRKYQSPGAGVTDGYESPCECWELNPGSLQEEQMFLVIDPSLQPIL